MLSWIKSIFANPKALIAIGVNALDQAVPLLAAKLEEVRTEFLKKTSFEQAQYVIDWVQAHLRNLFKLPPEA
jgi:hypothetical protein